MDCHLKNGRIFLILTLTVATASNYVFAGSSTATSSAGVIEFTRIEESVAGTATSAFVSGTTGDLIIRLSRAASVPEGSEFEPVILALRSKLNGGNASETGLLNGNPVRNVDLHTAKDDQTGVQSISIVVDYN